MRRYARRTKYWLRDFADLAKRRWHDLLRPPPWLDGTCGLYHLLTRDPPILYMGHWSDYGSVQRSMTPLFEALRDLPLTLLIGYFWQIEDDKRVQLVKGMYDVEHRRRYPCHKVVHLCNTPRQFEMFRDAGMPAVYSNQAAMADEQIYRPLPGVERAFDAVYDARLLPFKRHHLAAGVPKLALIHRDFRHDGHRRYARSIDRLLRGAHRFNRDADGCYRVLDGEAVSRAYNRCRVGLCLSAVEGAMFASIQYLLAGLPVVSTRSGGGRDLFYDERTALIVDDDPDAVREGVAEMIRRDPDPHTVRDITLEKMAEHRARFVATIQEVYDEHGFARSAAGDWPEYYCDKMFHDANHADTIAALRG